MMRAVARRIPTELGNFSARATAYADAASLVGLGPGGGLDGGLREISGFRQDSARGTSHDADTVDPERDELDTITLHGLSLTSRRRGWARRRRGGATRAAFAN